MSKCIACDNELQDDMCQRCNSSQKPQLCGICGKGMPAGALRCNSCGTYQRPWRRRIQLWSIQATWISAIFALISATFAGVAYVDQHMSHTQFRVTGSKTEAIHLEVWNTGLRPSMLTAFRLVFDGAPRKVVKLALFNQDQPDAVQFIAGAQQLNVDLSRAGSTESNDELRRLLCGPEWTDQRVTLQVDVEESLIFFQSNRTREETFRTGRISDFIQSWGLNGPCR